MGYSDYVVIDVYKEIEGKLVEFLTQDNQVIILTKANNSANHVLKIFNVVNDRALKLDCEVQTNDNQFISNISTVESSANNIIPCGNSIYVIVKFSG